MPFSLASFLFAPLILLPTILAVVSGGIALLARSALRRSEHHGGSLFDNDERTYRAMYGYSTILLCATAVFVAGAGVLHFATSNWVSAPALVLLGLIQVRVVLRQRANLPTRHDTDSDADSDADSDSAATTH